MITKSKVLKVSQIFREIIAKEFLISLNYKIFPKIIMD